MQKLYCRQLISSVLHNVTLTFELGTWLICSHDTEYLCQVTIKSLHAISKIFQGQKSYAKMIMLTD